MTYTIYKSSDPDAPQLTNTAGSLKTILKACLITGYGTGADEKPAAGWLMPFEEANTAVFQPVDKNGENLMIQIGNANSSSVSLLAYSAMTDINTGTRAYAHMGYHLYTNSPTWWLIGTKQWALFLMKPNHENGVSPLFMGNTERLLPEQQSKTLIVHGNLHSNSYSIIYCLFRYNASRATDSNTKMHTGFNAESYNLKAPNSLAWFDVFVANQNDVIGRLPCIKACTAYLDKPLFSEVSPNVYNVTALNNGSGDRLATFILDMNDAG